MNVAVTRCGLAGARRLMAPLLAVACACTATGAAGQSRVPPLSFEPPTMLYAGGAGPRLDAAAAPNESKPPSQPTPDQLRLRNAAVIGAGVAVVGIYGAAKWWQDGFTGDFRTENEGWFGQDTKYGGADKLGHAFSSYTGMRVVTRAFEAVGNEPGAASSLAAWSTFGVMLGIEVLDGYSKQYRFSAEDALMNVAGIGFGYLIERNRALDDLLDFRLLYRKSHSSNFDPAGDYSGQTYLLNLKASGVPALRANPVARYLELAVGYGTRGYQGPPGVQEERNLYFGVSLNLSEILARTVFRGAKERGGAQRAADLFLEFVQVPGTAALAGHRL